MNEGPTTEEFDHAVERLRRHCRPGGLVANERVRFETVVGGMAEVRREFVESVDELDRLAAEVDAGRVLVINGDVLRVAGPSPAPVPRFGARPGRATDHDEATGQIPADGEDDTFDSTIPADLFERKIRASHEAFDILPDVDETAGERTCEPVAEWDDYLDGALPPVVGIAGRKRSGKNTAAEGLVPLGYRVVGFADDLKVAALELDPWVDRFFGNLVRLSTLVERYGWEDVKDRFPEVRRILQRLGTEVVRKRDASLWVRTLEREVGDDLVVVADVRMKGEAEWVRARGGVVIEVVRPSLPDDGDTHESEQALPDHLVDAHVLNSGTPEQLQLAVAAFVSSRRGV